VTSLGWSFAELCTVTGLVRPKDIEERFIIRSQSIHKFFKPAEYHNNQQVRTNLQI
jgi:hypothetical protein